MGEAGVSPELHSSLAVLRLLAEAIGDRLLDPDDLRRQADLMVWHVQRVDELIEAGRRRG